MAVKSNLSILHYTGWLEWQAMYYVYVYSYNVLSQIIFNKDNPILFFICLFVIFSSSSIFCSLLSAPLLAPLQKPLILLPPRCHWSWHGDRGDSRNPPTFSYVSITLSYRWFSGRDRLSDNFCVWHVSECQEEKREQRFSSPEVPSTLQIRCSDTAV